MPPALEIVLEDYRQLLTMGATRQRLGHAKSNLCRAALRALIDRPGTVRMRVASVDSPKLARPGTVRVVTRNYVTVDFAGERWNIPLDNIVLDPAAGLPPEILQTFCERVG